MRCAGALRRTREKQRLEIENFSGRTPWVLLQDFHAKIFAQNLTAIFVRLAQWLADARYQHRRHGYRINFANALSKMKNNLVRLFLETSPLELSWRLLQRMADAVEAVRPGRKFPIRVLPCSIEELRLKLMTLSLKWAPISLFSRF